MKKLERLTEKAIRTLGSQPCLAQCLSSAAR